MGNDDYGDCVFACVGHVTGVETANAGTPFHATLQQVLAMYSAVTGFDPNDPSTDNGANIQDALNYWQAHGFANGTKILGYLSVDATNWAEVQSALYLFENLILGMELPDAYVNPFPSGDGALWDVAGDPVPENGHCVGGCAYNANGELIVDTWGMLVRLTRTALAKYATPSNGGELWVVLTPDQLAKGQAKAPNGVAWSSLVADFDSIGGHVPIPSPPPAPPPSGPITLVQAQTLVANALHRAPFFLTHDTATTIAKNALAAGWPKP
jgi:hypothetical protein